MKVDATHLTSLFEYATEGIVLTNGEGKIVLMNPASLRMFGYEKNEIIGKPIEVLIPVRYHHHHAALREGFYEHPQNRVMGHGRDLYAQKQDGTNMPVEVSLGFYRREGELFCDRLYRGYHASKKDRAKYPEPAKRTGEDDGRHEEAECRARK